MLGLHFEVEYPHLFRNDFGRTQMKFVSRNWLGTPVAPVGAASTRHHIHRKVAVSLRPRFPVGRKIDEVARGMRQGCPFRVSGGPLHVVARFPMSVETNKTGYILHGLCMQQRGAELGQSLLSFALQNEIDSVLKKQ